MSWSRGDSGLMARTLRRVLEAFEEGGDSGKPAYLQVHLAWAETDVRARQIAHAQWKTNVFDSSLAWNLQTPEQFDAAARFVSPENEEEAILVASDLDQHTTWLRDLAGLGFGSIYLHHVTPSNRSSSRRLANQYSLPEVLEVWKLF